MSQSSVTVTKQDILKGLASLAVKGGFERIGAGDRATLLADRRSRLNCARSLAR